MSDIDGFFDYEISLFKKVWWPIKRFITRITDIPTNIKYFIQRGKRGWSDDKCWSVDYYLIEITLPMLKRLRANLHGYPTTMTKVEWDNALDSMIAGFESAKRIVDLDYDNIPSDKFREAYDKDKVIFDKGMKLFSENFLSLWD